ncbi:MAG: hypothetical protein GY862_31870, partial [Gammaproteobacteria bacterium]|nr:hypothetical protein [Gammaproteobacteria bacterium]
KVILCILTGCKKQIVVIQKELITMFNLFKKKNKNQGPDFSHVNSKEKAIELANKGELEPLFLMPLDFGGEEIPLNMLFVPVGIAQIPDSTVKCNLILLYLLNWVFVC